MPLQVHRQDVKSGLLPRFWLPAPSLWLVNPITLSTNLPPPDHSMRCDGGKLEAYAALPDFHASMRFGGGREAGT